MLSVAVVIIASATALVAYEQTIRICQQEPVLWGIVGFTLAYFLFLKKRIAVFQTLDHELSHALVSVLSGHKVLELTATARQGGLTRHQGNNHHFLIALAPYIWRIPSLLVTFIIWLMNENHPDWYFLTTFGVVFAYRAISIISEAKPYQTDLQKVGLFKSYIWIVSLNIIWIGVLTTAMSNNYGLENYGRDVWHNFLYCKNLVIEGLLSIK